MTLLEIRAEELLELLSSEEVRAESEARDTARNEKFSWELAAALNEREGLTPTQQTFAIASAKYRPSNNIGGWEIPYEDRIPTVK